MKTVHTKEELVAALKSGETHIIAKGEIAETLRKKKKRRTAALIGGGLLAVGGIIAAPFTGGASIPIGLASGFTVGAVTMTTAELLILCTTGVGLGALGVAAYGIHKNRKVKLKFNANGSVNLDFL